MIKLGNVFDIPLTNVLSRHQISNSWLEQFCAWFLDGWKIWFRFDGIASQMSGQVGRLVWDITEIGNLV